MSQRFLVRTGLFSEHQVFNLSPGLSCQPGMQVVCRTTRGTEVGEVMAEWLPTAEDVPTTGKILRPINEQDRLIIERLARFKIRAVESCEQLLRERGINAALVDAEQLFDGQHLFFYFWGDVSPELEAALDELGRLYDRRIGFSKFAERLAEGCGPGCGTTKSSCGTSGGCGTCGSGGCGLKPAKSPQAQSFG